MIPPVTSLVMAIALSDMETGFVCAIFSLVLGSMIAMMILSGPVMIDDPELTEIAMVIALGKVARMLIIVNATPTFIGVILGSLLSSESQA